MIHKNKKIKSILSFIIAAVLCFCSIFVGFAVEDNVGTTEEKTNTEARAESDEEKTDTEVKAERKEGQAPVLGEGETGVLIDAISGNVVFEQEGSKRMYPASTTKIMTALLVVEAVERGEISMEAQVEVTSGIIDGLDPDGSNMALKAGEIISVENLLKGMMIQSGNDAAWVLADFVGKGHTAFIDMMNARATELGCTNTNFANPDGIHDDNHYTTAADMARIAYKAMQFYEFRNIVDCVHIKIPPTNMSEERYYINTNGLLSTMRYLDYYYKNSNGIKTGYTQKAGNCLVSSASRDGMEFIAVVFGAKDVTNSHRDSIEMLDYGFEAHTPITPLAKGDLSCEVKVRQAKGTDTLALATASAVTVIVPKGTETDKLELRPNLPESVAAPINAGDKIGTISVLLNGVELSSCDLLASTAVERSFFWPIMAVGDFLWGNTITRTIICLLGAVLLAFVALFVIAICKNIKREKRHRQRRKNKRIH